MNASILRRWPSNKSGETAHRTNSRMDEGEIIEIKR